MGPADPITIFHILYHTVIIISLWFGLYVISFARYFMLGRIWNITMRLGQPTPSHPRLPRFRKRNVKYRRTIEKMESLGFVLWLFSIKVYPISLAYDRRHPAESWVRNYIYCSQLWTLRYIDGKTISFRTFQSSRLWKGKLCCCSLWWLPWVFTTTTMTWWPPTLGKIICGTSQGVKVT